MPQARPSAGSSEDWLSRAKGDLALAQAPLPPGAFYEDLCFHAQQAAEKALKAVYVHRGLTFRFTHDLAELISGLERARLTLPEGAKDAIALTPYAHDARYPGLSEPVTAEEHQRAVELAGALILWVETTMD